MIISSTVGQSRRNPLAMPRQKSGQQPSSQAQRLILPDQRLLGYTEFGAAHGRPVVYFHDAGSSRLEAGLFAASARKTGVRLIAFERPGIGLSTPNRGGGAAAVARDVIALSDYLGVEKIDLLALGSGGVHALTLAKYYPERVGAQAFIGGVSGSVFNEAPGRTVLTRCWSGFVPPMIRLAVHLKHRLFPEDAEQNIHRLLARLSFTDRKLLSDPGFTCSLIRDQQEALRQGPEGVAGDFALAYRELDFSLTEIEVPSFIWQGAADRLSQSTNCQFMASRLPNSQLYRVAHAGHFFFLNRMDQVFATLTAGVWANSLAA